MILRLFHLRQSALDRGRADREWLTLQLEIQDWKEPDNRHPDVCSSSEWFLLIQLLSQARWTFPQRFYLLWPFERCVEQLLPRNANPVLDPREQSCPLFAQPIGK